VNSQVDCVDVCFGPVIVACVYVSGVASQENAGDSVVNEIVVVDCGGTCVECDGGVGVWSVLFRIAVACDLR
jgi:hypothetical protein